MCSQYIQNTLLTTQVHSTFLGNKCLTNTTCLQLIIRDLVIQLTHMLSYTALMELICTCVQTQVQVVFQAEY